MIEKLILTILTIIAIYHILRYFYNAVQLYRCEAFWAIPGRKPSSFFDAVILGDRLYLPRDEIKGAKFLSSQYSQKIARWTLFGKAVITTWDSKAIQHILVTNQLNYPIKGEVPPTALMFLGDSSMIFCQGEMHQRHRAIGSPYFKYSNLENFIKPVIRSTNNLIYFWSEKCSGSGQFTDALGRDLSGTTLDIIVEIGVGIVQNSFCNISELGKLYNAVLTEESQETKSELRAALEWFAFVPSFETIRKMFYLKNLKAQIDDLIKESLNSFNKKCMLPYRKPTSYADILAQAISKGSMNKIEARHELMTILLAGHETTSNAVLWALMLLAKHPQVQDTARKEAQAHLQSEISYESTKKLLFLSAVVHESLRLYPVVNTTVRRSTAEDTTLGYRIPANSNVILEFLAMHRDADVWHDSESFMPERFLEPPESVPWDSWMPFGGGPHKCLGHQFALLEIKTILAMLLKSFRFSLANPSQEYAGSHFFLIMKPKPDIILTVSPV